MSSNHTLECIKGDLNIKLIAMSLLAVIVAFVLFFRPLNLEDVLAALIIFGIFFVIFLIGILSDLRALKHYKRILKDNQSESELKEFYDEKRK